MPDDLPGPSRPEAFASAALDPAVLDEITDLTVQAAVDGLSLETVFAELRAVLDLEPGQEIPIALVRACAVTWADASRDLPPAAVSVVDSRAELDDRLWSALSVTGPEQAPVLVRLFTVGDEAGSASMALRLLGGGDGLVALAADLLVATLDPASEIVLIWRRAGRTDQAVALLDEADGRLEALQTRLAEIAPGGPRVGVRVTRVDGGPGDRLSVVRQALDDVTDR